MNISNENLIRTFGIFQITNDQFDYFNRDLNRGCLVYMFCLRFLGITFLINSGWQFRVRKTFSCT